MRLLVVAGVSAWAVLGVSCDLELPAQGAHHLEQSSERRPTSEQAAPGAPGSRLRSDDEVLPFATLEATTTTSTTSPPTPPPPTTRPPTTTTPTTTEPPPTTSEPGQPASPPADVPPHAAAASGDGVPVRTSEWTQLVADPARAVERLSSASARETASRAVGLIRYDWRNGLPGWELRFVDGRRGYRGLTHSTQRVIEVFVRDDDTPVVLAHVTAHEIAHAIDVTYFGPEQRGTWAAVRGLRPGAPWFVQSGGSDFASGAGDFAESFAWWQTTGSQWFGQLGPPPTVTQLGVLAQLTGAS